MSIHASFYVCLALNISKHRIIVISYCKNGFISLWKNDVPEYQGGAENHPGQMLHQIEENNHTPEQIQLVELVLDFILNRLTILTYANIYIYI